MASSTRQRARRNRTPQTTPISLRSLYHFRRRSREDRCPVPHATVDVATIVSREFGHLAGSALCGLRLERLAETCTLVRWTVTDIPWEVAPRAPVQG